MTQSAIQVSESPPLPGLALVQQTNSALMTVATDFAGSSDPAALAPPYATWADTVAGVVKRRNAAGTGWVTVARIFNTALSDIPQEQIPGVDVGTIYVPGRGIMRWASTIAQYRTVECGQILMAGSFSPPQGTLEANGADLSKTTYFGLWSWAVENSLTTPIGSWLAGTAYYGDVNATTFRLPNLRGRFFRSANPASTGLDPSRSVGTAQDHGVANHIHTAAGVGPAGSGGTFGPVFTSTGSPQGSQQVTNGTSNAVPDTRPSNTALLACIQY